MYVWVPHLCGTSGGQKRVSDILELELQMIDSYPVGRGIEAGSSEREVSAFKPLDHLSNSMLIMPLLLEYPKCPSYLRHAAWYC